MTSSDLGVTGGLDVGVKRRIRAAPSAKGTLTRVLSFLWPRQEATPLAAKQQPMGLLKVSSRSNPNAVAGAFAGVVRERGRVEVQVVGAGALNQAIKAVAIARSMLGAQGVDLVCVPAFAEIEIDGQPRTAMQLVVERRDLQDRTVVLDPQLTATDDLPDLRIETDRDADAGKAAAPLLTRPVL